MCFLDAITGNLDAIAKSEEPGKIAIELSRKQMKEMSFRFHNAIWHSGMELRGRAESVNLNRFRSMTGRVTAGPDIDGSDHYEVTWFFEEGGKFVVFSETDIRHNSIIAEI